MNKKKLFSAIGGLVIDLVVVAAIAFTLIRVTTSFSYSLYFVDGMSMAPTLRGDTSVQGGCYFGLEDNSQSAINHIERFDIVSTYYNFSETDFAQPYQRNAEKLNSATLKIKRVMAIPGDTIVIDGDYFSISFVDKNGKSKCYEFTSDNCPFRRLGDANNGGDMDHKKVEGYILGEDEYFVMGDNWTRGASLDSCTTDVPDQPICHVYKECIFGVAINIQGAGTVESYLMCPECGNENEIGAWKCAYCYNTNLYYGAEIKDKQMFKKEVSLKNLWNKYIGSLDI